MITLSEHCWNLSKFAIGNNSKKSWEQVYEYLNVSASIVGVEIDLTRYDSSFGWCKNSDYWQIAREKILQEYILELSRFTYIWGGFEALIDAIKPGPSPTKGKINKICYYLLTELHPSDDVALYSNQLEKLHLLINLNDISENSIKKRFVGNKYIPHQGLGVYVVYKLRNLFQHGALTFPEPEPHEHKPISSYPEMVAVSSRIVLLTMQMIYLAHIQKNTWDDFVGYEIFNDEKIGPEETIRMLHRNKKIKNEKQLTIC